MRNTLLTTTAALLLAAAPAFASGDVVPGDALRGGIETTGWDAWYGCWMSAGDEEVQDETGTSVLVCVLPGVDAQTARMATVEDGRIVDEVSITADGQSRAVDNGGCTGTEMARFSADGRRVYTRADLDCRSFQRVSTGVIAMVSETEWIETQGVTVSGQATGRTVRYRAVPASAVPASIRAQLPADERMALEAVRLNAAVPLDVDAVIEAADAVGGPALEALMAARQQSFDLDARDLARLGDAGVPASTIDVMVALSYPEKFAVRETSSHDEFDQRATSRNAALDDYCDYMYRSARRPIRRGYYGYGSSYECDAYGMNYGYNSMYGNRYGYNTYYDPYRWNRTPVIVEEVVRGGTVTTEGYTRGDVPARGTAKRRSGESSRPTSAPPSGARSTPTSASPPPASPPSEPPRRAKPRPPGGGGNS